MRKRKKIIPKTAPKRNYCETPSNLFVTSTMSDGTGNAFSSKLLA
jgi:hypothetical protein